MLRRLGAACAFAAVFSTAAASLWAADPCGVNNSAVATTIALARDKSLFVLAYEAPPGKGTFKDRDGRQLVFVGNAFLIDILESESERIGFFATAKHNLAAACIDAKKMGSNGAPKVRLVAANGASLATAAPSAPQCERLIKTTETAGNRDVVFNPDLTVLSGPLPSGTTWLPILIGSIEATTSTGGGGVEHMDGRLTALPAIMGNLPSRPVRPEQIKYGWIRVIAGNNDHGVSGSAFITTLSNSVPVALGTVTHSFPPGRNNSEDEHGASDVVDESVLTATEVKNLVTATLGDLSGTGYSLISTFDVLDKEYDPAPPSGAVAQLFKAAERTGFKDMSGADLIRRKMAGAGASAIVYIRHQCEALAQSPDLLLKYTFCQKALVGSTVSQCLYTPDQYLDYASAAFQENSGGTYQKPGNAVKAANEARQILNTGGADAAKGVVPILQAALAEPLSGKTIVRPGWDSAAVFDLAKAERAAGGDTGDYLKRLRQAIEIDPGNILAKRAFVDAVAQNGAVNEAKEAVGYLRDLVAAKQMTGSLATETHGALRRLARQ